MTLVTAQEGQVEILNKALNQVLTLKLFSNNHTPDDEDDISDYDEVTGGGYTDIDLSFANWVVTPGAPSVAVYTDFQDFNFTGATGGPGSIYGYYIVNPANILMWAERFDPADVPFTPVNGSLVRIKPRITNQNQ
jgi:hypothetical protein